MQYRYIKTSFGVYEVTELAAASTGKEDFWIGSIKSIVDNMYAGPKSSLQICYWNTNEPPLFISKKAILAWKPL